MTGSALLLQPFAAYLEAAEDFAFETAADWQERYTLSRYELPAPTQNQLATGVQELTAYGNLVYYLDGGDLRVYDLTYKVGNLLRLAKGPDGSIRYAVHGLTHTGDGLYGMVWNQLGEEEAMQAENSGRFPVSIVKLDTTADTEPTLIAANLSGTSESSLSGSNHVLVWHTPGLIWVYDTQQGQPLFVEEDENNPPLFNSLQEQTLSFYLQTNGDNLLVVRHLVNSETTLLNLPPNLEASQVTATANDQYALLNYLEQEQATTLLYAKERQAFLKLPQTAAPPSGQSLLWHDTLVTQTETALEIYSLREARQDSLSFTELFPSGQTGDHNSPVSSCLTADNRLLLWRTYHETLELAVLEMVI